MSAAVSEPSSATGTLFSIASTSHGQLGSSAFRSVRLGRKAAAAEGAGESELTGFTIASDDAAEVPSPIQPERRYPYLDIIREAVGTPTPVQRRSVSPVISLRRSGPRVRDDGIESSEGSSKPLSTGEGHTDRTPPHCHPLRRPSTCTNASASPRPGDLSLLSLHEALGRSLDDAQCHPRQQSVGRGIPRHPRSATHGGGVSPPSSYPASAPYTSPHPGRRARNVHDLSLNSLHEVLGRSLFNEDEDSGADASGAASRGAVRCEDDLATLSLNSIHDALQNSPFGKDTGVLSPDGSRSLTMSLHARSADPPCARHTLRGAGTPPPDSGASTRGDCLSPVSIASPLATPDRAQPQRAGYRRRWGPSPREDGPGATALGPADSSCAAVQSGCAQGSPAARVPAAAPKRALRSKELMDMLSRLERDENAADDTDGTEQDGCGEAEAAEVAVEVTPESVYDEPCARSHHSHAHSHRDARSAKSVATTSHHSESTAFMKILEDYAKEQGFYDTTGTVPASQYSAGRAAGREDETHHSDTRSAAPSHHSYSHHTSTPFMKILEDYAKETGLVDVDRHTSYSLRSPQSAQRGAGPEESVVGRRVSSGPSLRDGGSILDLGSPRVGTEACAGHARDSVPDVDRRDSRSIGARSHTTHHTVHTPTSSPPNAFMKFLADYAKEQGIEGIEGEEDEAGGAEGHTETRSVVSTSHLSHQSQSTAFMKMLADYAEENGISDYTSVPRAGEAKDARHPPQPAERRGSGHPSPPPQEPCAAPRARNASACSAGSHTATAHSARHVLSGDGCREEEGEVQQRLVGEVVAPSLPLPAGEGDSGRKGVQADAFVEESACSSSTSGDEVQPTRLHYCAPTLPSQRASLFGQDGVDDRAEEAPPPWPEDVSGDLLSVAVPMTPPAAPSVSPATPGTLSVGSIASANGQTGRGPRCEAHCASPPCTPEGQPLVVACSLGATPSESENRRYRNVDQDPAPAVAGPVQPTPKAYTTAQQQDRSKPPLPDVAPVPPSITDTSAVSGVAPSPSLAWSVLASVDGDHSVPQTAPRHQGPIDDASLLSLGRLSSIRVRGSATRQVAQLVTPTLDGLPGEPFVASLPLATASPSGGDKTEKEDSGQMAEEDLDVRLSQAHESDLHRSTDTEPVTPLQDSSEHSAAPSPMCVPASESPPKSPPHKRHVVSPGPRHVGPRVDADDAPGVEERVLQPLLTFDAIAAEMAAFEGVAHVPSSDHLDHAMATQTLDIDAAAELVPPPLTLVPTSSDFVPSHFRPDICTSAWVGGADAVDFLSAVSHGEGSTGRAVLPPSHAVREVLLAPLATDVSAPPPRAVPGYWESVCGAAPLAPPTGGGIELTPHVEAVATNTARSVPPASSEAGESQGPGPDTQPHADERPCRLVLSSKEEAVPVPDLRPIDEEVARLQAGMEHAKADARRLSSLLSASYAERDAALLDTALLSNALAEATGPGRHDPRAAERVMAYVLNTSCLAGGRLPQTTA